MCIGSLCEGLAFGDLFGIRILGPVDNVEGYNFKSTLDLFNGSLFKSILSDNILKKEKREGKDFYEDDEYSRFYCEHDNHWNWCTIHNNFETKERKNMFLTRISNFNNFKRNLDKDSFYLYTISKYDNELSDNDFEYVINKLPKYVVDHLIIISGTRCKIPNYFYNNFRCFQFNYDLTHQMPNMFEKWASITEHIW